MDANKLFMSIENWDISPVGLRCGSTVLDSRDTNSWWLTVEGETFRFQPSSVSVLFVRETLKKIFSSTVKRGLAH